MIVKKEKRGKKPKLTLKQKTLLLLLKHLVERATGRCQICLSFSASYLE